MTVIGPLQHGAHGALGTIAIIDLEPEAIGGEVGLHALERQRHVAPQNAFGGVVAGQRPADEVVEARVAHVLGDARIDIAEIGQTGRQGALRPRLPDQALTQAQHQGRRDGCAPPMRRRAQSKV
jgi:hypothetical protein